MNKHYIVTFQNTHEAMKAERETVKKQIKVVVIPTPTYITKSCGISLKVCEEDIQGIINLIKAENIKVKEIFMKNGESVKNITI
ncbi:DUF3343 domain-containing protein [Clostridium estertheticum]|uniref:DUF3343 domain-containing protein n=2 Tax=Clostridium estertheticum TaxID=238834 RepID=A0A7Y3SZU0_9CLOT|nr:DUF3343 domain-containing protein [Clostridium estertheticum]APC42498.1 hypothetical protein A7L45_21885 [Clostridium estertheticum subsp. estertheticum]MBU3075637.1 DUF3343 domain-containing protein [Clostridium estertheticum]MBU3164781.1 DUF3343 domain-containing protein [Clostridium estertheticum]MBU3173681.1 DUF3343 domain-containing protein [Clostridium estertheticum]MBX4262033.1 DUF3343 domain-containing protein [Clostridium estertheticum]